MTCPSDRLLDATAELSVEVSRLPGAGQLQLAEQARQLATVIARKRSLDMKEWNTLQRAAEAFGAPLPSKPVPLRQIRTQFGSPSQDEPIESEARQDIGAGTVSSESDQAAAILEPHSAPCSLDTTGETSFEPREIERLIQQLVDEHGRTILMLAVRLVGRADCEDVAQDALLQLLRWIRTRPPSDVLALVRTPNAMLRLVSRLVAVQAYNRLRQRRRPSVLKVRESVTSEPTARLPTEQSGDIVERLERAYATLPPMQRIAHVLHYYYGFTDVELASMLETSAANSRSLVCRATRTLRLAIASSHEEG